MSAAVNGARNIRTITFAKTIRETRDDAFAQVSLASVILNEGLETLGAYYDDDDTYNSGVFKGAHLKHVTLPSTLKVLGDKTFYRCKKLKSVTFQNGSKLERIGKRCFAESGLEKITIPNSVTTIYGNAFCECKALKSVSF